MNLSDTLQTILFVSVFFVLGAFPRLIELYRERPARGPVTGAPGGQATTVPPTATARSSWVKLASTLWPFLSGISVVLVPKLFEPPDCDSYVETILRIEAAVPEAKQAEVAKRLNFGKAERCIAPEQLLKVATKPPSDE